jgi:hypothetical protein
VKKIALTVLAVALVAAVASWAGNEKDPKANSKNDPKAEATYISVEKGAKWLASVQGNDGGWGQDGGETSYVRQGERLESNGNDIANTAVAVLALRRAGKEYQANVDRGLAFILARVEKSPVEGLALTTMSGTQIQRKLGPYIDTFLTSMLLSEVDGTLTDAKLNGRVRVALEKCVAKIQRNQQSDGSWNVGGGWAPVLGTSMASRSLDVARQKGVRVDENTVAKAEVYARDAVVESRPVGGVGAGSGRTIAASAPAAAAGVALYQNGQALEAMTRTESDRKKNAPKIAEITSQLADQRFVDGYGSMGGEEFFSYLNISDGLRRAGGEPWNKWHAQITQKILTLQNNDGTWAGHHCITGRVATTSAAMLNLTVDREPLRNAHN